MENGVVHVEDCGLVGELGGVPVVVGREDRRLSESVDSEYVGFHSLIRGISESGEEEVEEEE